MGAIRAVMNEALENLRIIISARAYRDLVCFIISGSSLNSELITIT